MGGAREEIICYCREVFYSCCSLVLKLLGVWSLISGIEVVKDFFRGFRGFMGVRVFSG